ncbi:MAG: helix-turn-helix transcriptional regulator [Bacteroidota bacterium]
MDTLTQQVGQQIRTIRSAKGLTQENIADMLGMTTSGYAKIERGQTEIGLSRLKKIAEALEIKPSQLLKQGEITEYNVQITGQNATVGNGSPSILHVHQSPDLENRFGEFGKLMESMLIRLEKLEAKS